MKHISLAKHLVARRVWRPLAKGVEILVLHPLVCAYVWLFTKRNLDRACYKVLTPLIRLHLYLAGKAATQQRRPQLDGQSSLAYDLAAIGAALLAPFVRWEQACRKRMNQETDPCLRHDPSRN